MVATRRQVSCDNETQGFLWGHQAVGTFSQFHETDWATPSGYKHIAPRCIQRQEESGSLQHLPAPRTAVDFLFFFFFFKYSSFFWLWRFLTLGARPSSDLHLLEFIQKAQIWLRSLGAMLVLEYEGVHTPTSNMDLNGLVAGNSSSPDKLRHEGKFSSVWSGHLTERYNTMTTKMELLLRIYTFKTCGKAGGNFYLRVMSKRTTSNIL